MVLKSEVLFQVKSLTASSLSLSQYCHIKIWKILDPMIS